MNRTSLSNLKLVAIKIVQFAKKLCLEKDFTAQNLNQNYAICKIEKSIGM